MSTDFDPYQQWLGIEPHERPVNHYRLLGIAPFTSDTETIRQAADQRMSEIRKYQVGRRGSQTQPILNALSGAKLCLLNPSTKSTYDAVLKASLGMQQAEHDIRPAASAASPPPPPQSPPRSEPPLAEPPLREPPAPEPPAPEPPVFAAAPRVDTSAHESFTGAADRRQGSQLPIVVLVVVIVAGAASWLLYQVWQEPSRKVVEPEPAATSVTPPVDIPPGETPPEETSPEVASVQPEEPVVTQQEGDGSIQLRPSAAELLGKLQLQSADSADAIVGWSEEEDRAVWRFHLTRPGDFRLRIEYSSAASAADHTYRIVSPGNFDKERSIQTDGTGAAADAFSVRITRGGDQQLEIVPDDIAAEHAFRVHRVELTPLGGGQ